MTKLVWLGRKAALGVIAAGAVLALAAPAMAETSASVGYLQTTLKDSGDAVDLGAVRGVITWDSPGMFGVEGEASLGIISGEDKVFGAEFKLDHQIGAFVTARALVGDKLTLRGRLGYISTKISATGLGGEKHSDIAYGVAAQWMFNEKNGIRGDYTISKFAGSADIDNLSVSYTRKF